MPTPVNRVTVVEDRTARRMKACRRDLQTVMRPSELKSVSMQPVYASNISIVKIPFFFFFKPGNYGACERGA